MGAVAMVARECSQPQSAWIVSFSVGMQLVLTLWNVLVGGAVLLLTLRSVHWRRAVEHDEAAGVDAEHAPGVDAA